MLVKLFKKAFAEASRKFLSFFCNIYLDQTNGKRYNHNEHRLEVTPINKQRFLAELGKLLTFMQEDDRARALELYNDIFDEVGNETAVLQLLVSPTRQAVNLARAYDSRDRKYQTDDGQEPAYQLVIEDLRRDALALIPAEQKPEEGQSPLFNDPAATENVFESLNLGILPEDHTESAEPDRPHTHESAFYPDEDREGESALLTPPPVVPAPVVEPVTPAVEEAPAPEADKLSDVDAFLKDFTLKDDFAAAEQTASTPTQVPSIPDEDAPRPLPEQPVKKEEPASVHVQEKPHHVDVSTLSLEPEEHPARTQPQQEHPPRTQPQEEHPVRTPQQRKKPAVKDLPDLTGPAEREVNVPLLILFIILAIPLGLLVLGLILSAALLTLSMAAVFGCVGISGLIAAFGFTVFADILVVFGLSLASTAIGLLLAWTFIWLLIGAIPGFIRRVLALGRKLCYKEVSA